MAVSIASSIEKVVLKSAFIDKLTD